MSTVALDCMGGDNGLVAAVRAGAQVSTGRQTSVLLVGDRARIVRALRLAGLPAEARGIALEGLLALK